MSDFAIYFVGQAQAHPVAAIHGWSRNRERSGEPGKVRSGLGETWSSVWPGRPISGRELPATAAGARWPELEPSAGDPPA